MASQQRKKVFYTGDIKRNGSAVEFRDAQTGGVTTPQNSEIVEINKEAYETVVIQAQEVLFLFATVRSL